MTFRQLRQSRQLSQVRLAYLAGVRQAIVARIDQGRETNPRISDLGSLARVLCVSYEDLATIIRQGKQ